MDALLNIIEQSWLEFTGFVFDLSQTVYQAITPEIFCFAFLAGFLCALPERQSKQIFSYRKKNKLFSDIRRSSNRLCLIAILFSVVYIGYFLGLLKLGYFLAVFFLAFFLRWLLNKVFKRLGSAGRLVNNLLTIFSGPLLIFTAWFFYTGELIEVFRQLAEKLTHLF